MLFLRSSRQLFKNFVFNRNYSLVLAETQSGAYHPSTLNAIYAASKLGKSVSCLVIDSNAEKIANDLASIEGVKSVHYKVSKDKLCIETMASFIQDYVKNANGLEYVIASGTPHGKGIIPRLAALFSVAPLSEVSDVVDGETFLRPIYTGNAIQKVKMTDKLKMFSIRYTTFAPAKSTGGSASVEEIAADIVPFSGVEWKSETLTESDLPSISSAKVIISGGRGLKSKENFEILYDLAKKMKAGVGASRAAVDAGYCPIDLQIGQTGITIAPEVYIAFGISGAIQHVTGIKDSKTIIAVNTNEDSPIFEMSDYYIVGDLFKVIPELKEKVKGSA